MVRTKRQTAWALTPAVRALKRCLELVEENPFIIRTAHQRLYDMVLSYGVDEIERDKTKITLRFRGREMAHQELGANLLARVREDLEEYGVVEQMPQMEGRQMIMVMSPKKKQ